MQSGHGFTGPDDIDSTPQAAYRDAAGRRHEAPGAPAMRFDSIPDYREGRSATLAPSAGSGLVDVLVCTAASLDACGILLLDGRPIAAGDGRYQFEIAPGRHRLEVQGYDAASTEFTVAAGETAHFTTGQSVAVRNQVDYRTQLYRVKDATDLIPVLSQRAANQSGIGCLTAVVGILLIVASAVTSQFAESTALEISFAAAVFIGLTALITGTALAFRTTGRLHKRAKANRLTVARVAPAAAPLTGPAVAFPSPYDAKEWSSGRTVRGPLMVFDLYLYRLARRANGTAAYTGTGEDLALAHAAGVRAWIDGTEVPSDWAAWYYPLAAGEHRCRVVYGDDEAELDFAFKVASVADMTVIHVPVRVFRVLDELAGTFTDLRPEIAQWTAKAPQSDVGAFVNADNKKAADWVPARRWLAE
ncbi:hypothetical protein [Glycomyces sp. NPDC048151]|uniref:hypothetical protein n=1 Tax=Glycomyces sp. NPDC048151 TaxID=3364002 RepID=UPI00371854A6